MNGTTVKAGSCGTTRTRDTGVTQAENVTLLHPTSPRSSKEFDGSPLSQFVEHEWHDHKVAMLGMVLIGLTVMGGVWAMWWAGTTWRTEGGKITSIESKYTSLVLVGKVLVPQEWTALHVAYGWNGDTIVTAATAYGWSWNADQNVNVVYDRTNGELVSCCS